VGSNRGLSRRLVGIIQWDASDRQDKIKWRGCYAVMGRRYARSNLIVVGGGFGGLHMYRHMVHCSYHPTKRQGWSSAVEQIEGLENKDVHRNRHQY
jgi:hypothetical protein